MKRLLFAILTIVVSLSACKKTTTTPSTTTTTTTSGTMTVTLNGKAWSAASTSNTLIFATDQNAGRFDLRGTASDKSLIILTMSLSSSPTLATGTYLYDLSSQIPKVQCLFSYLNASGSMALISQGQMKITSVNNTNKICSGTFSFQSDSTMSPIACSAVNGTFTNCTWISAIK